MGKIIDLNIKRGYRENVLPSEPIYNCDGDSTKVAFWQVDECIPKNVLMITSGKDDMKETLNLFKKNIDRELNLDEDDLNDTKVTFIKLDDLIKEIIEMTISIKYKSYTYIEDGNKEHLNSLIDSWLNLDNTTNIDIFTNIIRNSFCEDIGDIYINYKICSAFKEIIDQELLKYEQYNSMQSLIDMYDRYKINNNLYDFTDIVESAEIAVKPLRFKLGGYDAIGIRSNCNDGLYIDNLLSKFFLSKEYKSTL